MNRRAEEIKKRIAKRKQKRMGSIQTSKINHLPFAEESFEAEAPFFVETDGNTKVFHPLFRSHIFISKILISACIVLAVGILYKNEGEEFLKARKMVETAMEKEFNFALVSKWYEEKFGHPLAISLPKKEEKKKNAGQYAVPATGKVLESFQDNGQGVMIETNKKMVEAMNEGIVIEAGEKEDTGLTVVIQHADGIETWYGHLEKINVALYDFVETGKPVGNVKQNSNHQGTYYFAIKKGDAFIDPSQVISFD